MKLFLATQFHMLGLEIVSHYIALIYEIVLHFELAIANSLEAVFSCEIKGYFLQHNFIRWVKEYTKLGRMPHNFIFVCEAIPNSRAQIFLISSFELVSWVLTWGR